MEQTCAYISIGIFFLGCLVRLYGTIQWMRAIKKTPNIPQYREALRAKYWRYRNACWIIWLVAVAVIFIPTLMR